MNETKMTRSYEVTNARLATSFESGTVRVLATPAVIALMEGLCCECAATWLPPEITTVGVEVCIKHTAATPPGAQISVSAELLEQDGRTFLFRVEASDAAGIVAEGTHKRASVKKETFAQKAQNRLDNIL